MENNRASDVSSVMFHRASMQRQSEKKTYRKRKTKSNDYTRMVI